MFCCFDNVAVLGNNVEATFDFVERTKFQRKTRSTLLPFWQQSRTLLRHCCQKRQQCRSNIRHYSAQTVRPLLKLTHERHILGISTSPRHDSQCLKLWGLSCTLITNIPRQYPFSFFWNLLNPCTEIRKFFYGLRMNTPTHIFISKMLNRCRISGHMSALYWWQKKQHVLASLDRTPGAISPIFVWVRTFVPHLYARFHPDMFRFGEI